MFKNLTAIIAGTLIALASAPANATHKDGPHGGGSPILDLLEPKTIFVTSAPPFFQGDFGGLAAADIICQNRADAPGSIVPAGDYVALLSISDDDIASARITASSGPYIRPDGAFVAADAAALFSVLLGSDVRDLINPIAIDEFGDPVPAARFVWTGTTVGGTSSGLDCLDWTTISGTEFGSHGDATAVDLDWIDEPALFNCSFMLRLYCVKR